MKNINYILILFLICSCTKEIDIVIPNNGRQFVVNGYIENNQIAKILVTRSLPYFDPINDNSIGQSLVNDATVTISNSLGQLEVLTPAYSPFFTNLTDTWYYNYSGSSILYGFLPFNLPVDCDAFETLFSKLSYANKSFFPCQSTV